MDAIMEFAYMLMTYFFTISGILIGFILVGCGLVKLFPGGKIEEIIDRLAMNLIPIYFISMIGAIVFNAAWGFMQ